MNGVANASCIFNKQQGILTIDKSSLYWRPDGHISPTFQLSYTQLQAIHVNSAKSDKALIKVTVYDQPGSTTTNLGNFYLFQFDSATLRDKIKNSLADQLSVFRSELASKASSNATSQKPSEVIKDTATDDPLLTLKRRLLETNDVMKEGYEELVKRKKLYTEDEFWQSYQWMLSFEELKENQWRGIPNQFIQELLKPNREDAPGATSTFGDTLAPVLKYTLTPSIIRSIFVQHPLLKQAHRDLVESQTTEKCLSDKEFWTFYFSSRYFTQKADLSLEDSLKNPIDLYFVQEQNEKDSNFAHAHENHSVLTDLTATQEDHITETVSPDILLKNDPRTFSLMKKLNRHSERILYSMSKQESSLVFGASIRYKDDHEAYACDYMSTPLLSNKILDFIDTTSEITKQPQMNNSQVISLLSYTRDSSLTALSLDAADWIKRMNLPTESRQEIIHRWKGHLPTDLLDLKREKLSRDHDSSLGKGEDWNALCKFLDRILFLISQYWQLYRQFASHSKSKGKLASIVPSTSMESHELSSIRTKYLKTRHVLTEYLQELQFKYYTKYSWASILDSYKATLQKALATPESF